MPQPVLNVINGGDYWAPFGETRWSAVRVISVADGVAEANRVNATTNEPKARVTSVNAAQLVARDPALNGDDKPDANPSDVFDGRATEEELRQARVLSLVDLLDDNSTTDDW